MRLTLLTGFLFLTQILFSQTFSELPQSIPFEDVGDGSIAFEDVDGDNDQDILITGRNNPLTGVSKLYINDGTGNFSEMIGTPFKIVSSSSIAFADIDGDNDQDVLIAGQTASGLEISNLYNNDGSGNFTEMLDAPFEGVQMAAVAFADIDSDMDQDVLITGRNSSGSEFTQLYTNDGAGNFTEMLDTPFEDIENGSIAFADVDNDNDQDVLITGRLASWERIAKLYINDGAGNYSEMIGTPFTEVDRGSIAFADVDGDNDQDVLITGRDSSFSEFTQLYFNDGSGIFSESMGPAIEAVFESSVAFADVDGDNDQDVLITGRDSLNVRFSKLYKNNGMGIFGELVGLPFQNVSSSSIAFADVDGDSDQDVFISGLIDGGGQISRLYVNGLLSSTDDSFSGFDLDLKLYPNPTKPEKLNIVYNSSENGLITLKVYNLEGQLLSLQKDFVNQREKVFSIDISSLTPGSYFLKVDNGRKMKVMKFTVL